MGDDERLPALRALAHPPGTLRQIAVAGLGHDEPTIVITNDLTTPPRRSSRPTPEG